MAVTTDMTAGSNVQSLGGGVFRISNLLDLSAVAPKNSGTAMVSTDIHQVLDIPANTFVRNVFTQIKTPSVATTLTATLGDGATVAGWDAAVDFEAAAGTVTAPVGGTDAYSTTNGKLYSTADTIDFVMTVDTISSLGTILVVAECFDPTYA